MKRQVPAEIYRGLPCSVVSVGCACGISDIKGLSSLMSRDLRDDGYLSLKGMNALVRANCEVIRCEGFKRGQRPALRDWAHSHLGQKAVICLLGHFIYFDGHDYFSFFWNGGDQVVKVWYLA